MEANARSDQALAQIATFARINLRARVVEVTVLDEGRSRWGNTTPCVEWLEVDYPALVRDLAPVRAQLVDFLGAERLPNEKAMAAVIDLPFYRRRA